MSHSYSSNAHSSDLQHEEPRERDFRGIADETLALHGRDCHASNHGFEAIKVGGVEDHAHASALAADTPFRQGSSGLEIMLFKMINDTKAAGSDFAWQEGYGAFRVSASQTEDVIRYIAGQAAHHAKRSYEEEFSIS
jgi:hypothetical protein